jgi:cyclopropane fatty-acyl-phospholipid synthase-like methyltransferase
VPLSNPQAVENLYSARLESYRRFISFFRSQQALQALLEGSGVLRPGLRVLDAGCGFGTASFALLNALLRSGLHPPLIHAFDLTPAMLARFQSELDRQGIGGVRLQQANVLALEQLPSSWTGYDLIVSASMLEYVGRENLAPALSALHARLASGGTLLVVITRKNWTTKTLIEGWWHAARYSRQELGQAFTLAGFTSVAFMKFPYRYFWQNFSNYVVVARGEK